LAYLQGLYLRATAKAAEHGQILMKTRGVHHASVFHRIIDIVVAEVDRKLTAAEALDQIATVLVRELVTDDRPEDS